MRLTNATRLRDLRFTLLGIPGLETYHMIFSVPMLCMFICALIGNCIIISVIMCDQALHAPMYFFLYMLALTDLFLSLTIAPKMLITFWFNASEIHFIACLIQMFFVQFLTIMESGILSTMALDRYVAICHPLRYASILTGQRIAGIGVILIVRAVVVVSPCFFLIIRLPFCKKYGIAQSYCDHMAIARLACADTTINSMYGLILVIIISSYDISCICLSYIWILNAVLKLSTKSKQSKAFSTCTSHVCVMSLFYIPGLFSLLANRIGDSVPHSLHSVLSMLYLLMPPSLNPIVYGVRTKQIRTNVIKFITGK
ncbi:olfactory receptor 52N2-like [Bombina bombina]|uniref:olfactory receptor 52N2-like n=1 Tax=Bombina bombina TaxID=8345 RepID=UPI00235A79F1|nr:olfactory receptor 52N2-like [Bombina bombina]